MQKGENVISIALAGVLVLATVAVHRRWQLSSLKELAVSAEEFILNTTGLRGQIPEIAGYAQVKKFELDRYRAALYRASPAPLIFAPGLFVVYGRDDKPVYKLETLEGSKESWTVLYDFVAMSDSRVRRRKRPVYTFPLTGTKVLYALVGQYSGGDHCCTSVTVLELGDRVTAVGRIGRLDGLPFEGLELQKVDQDPAWEFVAHRPYRTICGTHEDAADVPAVYDYVDGQYSDHTLLHVSYLQDVLRENLAKWSKEKERTMRLLQTLSLEYAVLGQREQAKRFFAMNLTPLVPDLGKTGVDPNACIEDVEILVDKIAAVVN
ncbi:MAG TPA: hypothetical protein VM182_02060 [Terriglobia bacterium]|nr:hypothetical protein [Terriglobia bacterium]